MKVGCTLLSALRLVAVGLLLLTSAIAYADIIIQAGETVTLSESEIISVDGDLTITGTLNGASSAKIRVTKDWNKTGTFTHNGTAVYLTGSGKTIISGTNEFYTLIIDHAESDTSSGKALEITSGTTQTITNTLTLKGTSTSNRIALTSSSSGTAAILNVNSAIVNAAYLNVKDSQATNVASATLVHKSNATGQSYIDPIDSIGSGSTEGWFTPPTASAVTTAQTLTKDTAMASFSPLTNVSGGTQPYVYSSGTLPAGLSLDVSTGAVTGTPTAAQVAANVVFQVKDANNAVASTTSTVSFTVNGPLTATAVTTAQTLTQGTAMASFSPLTNVSGGTQPYSYSLSSGATYSNTTDGFVCLGPIYYSS